MNYRKKVFSSIGKSGIGINFYDNNDFLLVEVFRNDELKNIVVTVVSFEITEKDLEEVKTYSREEFGSFEDGTILPEVFEVLWPNTKYQLDVLELLIKKTDLLENNLRRKLTIFGETEEQYLYFGNDEIGKVSNIQPVHDTFVESPEEYYCISLLYSYGYGAEKLTSSMQLYFLKLIEYIITLKKFKLIFEVDCDQHPWLKINNRKDELTEILKSIQKYIKTGIIETKALEYTEFA